MPSIDKRLMKPFHIDEAILIAGWCGAVLWGMYSMLFCLYFILLRLQTRTNAYGSNFRPTTIAVLIMYLLATGHISLMLYELIMGFNRTSTDAEEQYYFTYGTPQAIAMVKNMIYVAVSVVGDGIVVWRLFIIWNGNYWVSIFPGIVIAATGVTGIIGSCAYVLPTNSGSIRTEIAFRLLATSSVLSLACNILLTGLIAGKIIYQQRRLDHLLGKTGPYLRLVLIIVESAAVIIVARVFELALGAQATTTGVDPEGNNSVYIVTFSMPQLLGIVPLTILIAVLAGFTSDHTRAGGGGNAETRERGQDRSIASGIMFALPAPRSHLHSTTIG